MIRKLLAAAAVASLAMSPDAPSLRKPSTRPRKQTIGELVKNEKTKAVLVKHLPDLIANPQLEQGYEMKFADIVSYVPDQLTPEKLKAVDEDLAKVTD